MGVPMHPDVRGGKKPLEALFELTPNFRTV